MLIGNDINDNLVGTSLVLIATDAFVKYKKATGGVLDETTTLLKITPDQYAKLKSLFFIVRGVCVLSLWVDHQQCRVTSLPLSLGSIRINP